MIKLAPRDGAEPHRTATPLELMFDLAAVIAMAAAASGLHHGIAEGHALETLPSFLAAFFMIWWSWMNYTWFASAYDNGSVAFRIGSMAAMFGALVIAAGIPAVFAGQPIYLCLLGFVIMRAAMALFWFGAAAGDAARRGTTLAYGGGIVAMQSFWVWLVLSIPPGSAAYAPLFLIGVAGELAVPAVAELGFGATTWHRQHIIERYGLFNIIVLGECFLAIVAILTIGDHDAPTGGREILVGATCAVVAFSLWGLYFTREDHLADDNLGRALQWGYGHFAIFAAGAATGAGFAVFHEVTIGHAAVGYRAASLAVAIPVAVYLLALWFVRDRVQLAGWPGAILPAAAAAIAMTPFIVPEALVAIAALTVATVVIRRGAVGGAVRG